MSTSYSYLDSCAARLNALLPRFPNISHFEVTEDEQEGNYYIHAIPSGRIMSSQRMNQVTADTYQKIAAALPKGEYEQEPETIAKKHPGTPLALEFYSKCDLVATITKLERMPAHHKPSEQKLER